MFKHEGSLQLPVTLEADLVLLWGAADGSRRWCVYVVALGAPDQPIIDSVFEFLAEICAHIRVARIAELQLRLLQKRARFSRVMWRMTRGAAQVALRVGRLRKATLFVLARMTGKTLLVDIADRCCFEGEYFCFVSSARDVLGSWSVARFAGLNFGSAFWRNMGFGVRSALDTVKELFVARTACLGSDV